MSTTCYSGQRRSLNTILPFTLRQLSIQLLDYQSKFTTILIV